MEEVDSISVAVSGIDINTVEPLDSRRLVAFINHFLCTSVTFLNQFAAKCEEKLEGLQHKMYRLESSLQILECKLASINPQQLSMSPAAPTPSSNTSQPLPSQENVGDGQSQPPSSSSDSTSGATGVQDQVPSSTLDEQTKSIPDSDKGQSSASSDAGTEDGDKSAKETLRNDPIYMKYFKMAAVGVPIQAMKVKMISEGLDPSVLDW